MTRRDFGSKVVAVSATVVAAGLAAPAVLGAAKPRVVIIGGGAGGATVARYVAKGSKDIDVTLINDSPTYSTCFFSNLYLGGFRSFESISHNYEKLAADYGINVVIDRAAGLEGDGRTVILAGGEKLSYDKAVVAPGIDFSFSAIDGYTPDVAEKMPHAWQAGAQAKNLKRQLLDMEDGGTFVICPPPNPFRCPPGPYERISMVAHYFKSYKPRSKIIVVDAKNKFSKQKLFEDGWARHFPGMVEWLPLDITGGVKAVDAASNTIITEDEMFQASVANVVPPQKAGEIAQEAGLADESGWCPIVPETLASRQVPDVHLVGDAIIPGDMPKSGFSANSQAKVCAQALLAELADKQAFKPRFRNTCWSLITTDDSVKVGASYEATEEKIAKIEGFISQADESDEVRAQTAAEARGWYDAITTDIFG
jgi:NADPH-dependent 2,4-dienoyl-CoA reductase/sulfur reductase-like enzyme